MLLYIQYYGLCKFFNGSGYYVLQQPTGKARISCLKGLGLTLGVENTPGHFDVRSLFFFYNNDIIFYKLTIRY